MDENLQHQLHCADARIWIDSKKISEGVVRQISH